MYTLHQDDGEERWEIQKSSMEHLAPPAPLICMAINLGEDVEA